MYLLVLVLIQFIHILIGCCYQLTITSTGAALNYNSLVLGTYRKEGISNGRDSYKNDNNNDRHLHFSPNKNWIVSIDIMHNYALLGRDKKDIRCSLIHLQHKHSVWINEIIFSS